MPETYIVYTNIHPSAVGTTDDPLQNQDIDGKGWVVAVPRGTDPTAWIIRRYELFDEDGIPGNDFTNAAAFNDPTTDLVGSDDDYLYYFLSGNDPVRTTNARIALLTAPNDGAPDPQYTAVFSYGANAARPVNINDPSLTNNGSFPESVGSGRASRFDDDDGNVLAFTQSLDPTTGEYSYAISKPSNSAIDGQVFDFFVCFSRGTLICTEKGEIPVEELSQGARVITQDNGAMPIRWIGSRKVSQVSLTLNPKLRPVVIPAGSLGKDMPKKDLRVSRQHRILVRSKIAKRLFDASEVLVPAHFLVGINGIYIENDCREIEYFHILLDEHSILSANSAMAESLYIGSQSLGTLPPEALEEIEILFPDFRADGFVQVPARYIPQKGKKVHELVGRHKKNKRELVSVGDAH